MSTNWSEAYRSLTDFIAQYPEVEINPGMVSIPETHRAGFYRLFDAAAAAFISEHFASQMTRAQAIGEHYQQAVQALVSRLGLAHIVSPEAVHRFLDDPVREMAGELFDTQFHVLKGKLTLQEFEIEAAKIVSVKFGHMHALAYEQWVALSLINLLEPGAIFQADVEESVKLGYDVMGAYQFDLRYALAKVRKAGNLSFDHEKNPRLTTPDTIFYSDRIGRFVSLRLDFLQPMWPASNRVEGRAWLPINRVAMLHRSILIYTASNPEALALVADAEKIDRPDVLAECWTESSPEMVRELKGNYEYLKPRQGTYLVTDITLPPALTEALEADDAHPEAQTEAAPAPRLLPISLINADLDASTLEPIADVLAKTQPDLAP